jgi:L,D-transpeptidase YbiS
MPPCDERWIRVDLGRQRLALFEGQRLLGEWPVSTALNGPGEQIDSGCTPRGEHRVRIKIGGGCPPNTVFVGRRPTGEVYSERLAEKHPGRDWILTRIIWLTGAETGRNRGPGCDTLRRYIYIHGCPDSAAIGIVGSHGCIRMRNADLIELFEQVHRGTRVLISDGDQAADA